MIFRPRHPILHSLALAGALALGCAMLAGRAAAQMGAPNQPDLTIDAATRNAAIDTLVSNLDSTYVFPDVAQKLIRDLRQRQKRHEYDALTSGKAFAESLTAQMQALTHDRHLRVHFRSDVIGATELTDEPSAAEREQQRRDAQLRNCGFDQARRLAGNVGYIDLRNFISIGDGAGDVAVAAMSFLNNTDAMIVDLRRNGGGDPATVQLLCSYFFGPDAHVHLNDLHSRTRNRTDQYWTLSYVPGPHYVDKPLYLLTSRNTGSGAEEFAYDLQTQKRAILVGETTAGAAHPGHFVRLGDHFAAFVADGRAINPVHDDDWEGRGVKPDVPVATDQALRTAHQAALRALIGKAPGADDRQRLERALDAALVFPDPYNEPRPSAPMPAAH
jgi:hypothetical protein